ncbi:MAG TPA: hypothetical protein VER33_05265 [Polyangiaceae bacterium]|nr:hypothetical protein [Polyangiaceae bacterium]
MSQVGGALRTLLSALLLSATALGLHNVYSDNGEVRSDARRLACGGGECDARLTRESRSPLEQSFSFETPVAGKRAGSSSGNVEVKCRRAFYFLGAYACVAEGALTR